MFESCKLAPNASFLSNASFKVKVTTYYFIFISHFLLAVFIFAQPTGQNRLKIGSKTIRQKNRPISGQNRQYWTSKLYLCAVQNDCGIFLAKMNYKGQKWIGILLGHLFWHVFNDNSRYIFVVELTCLMTNNRWAINANKWVMI